MDAIAEQRAALEAAPVLRSGSLELGADQLSGSLFVWIEVEQDGLYSISLSVPGALVLGTFPTADGRYDGQTKPQLHGSSMSQTVSPAMGPLLLSPAHPYLLSVSSSAGAGALELSLDEAAPPLSEFPERGTAVPEGATLYASFDRADLILSGSTEARRVEIIGEARAALSARLGNESVPSGGRFPWVTDDDANLWFQATAAPESAPPRVLVKVSKEPGEFDETEPNEIVPDSFDIDTPFEGLLLQGDEDRLQFSLPAANHLSLSVKTSDPQGRFRAGLVRLENKKEIKLWNQQPSDGILESASLTLQSGEYQLRLERVDTRHIPLSYSVVFSPGEAPGPNREQEPNDTPAAAMPMPDSLRVSATATSDDIDVFQFSVPDEKAQHLWRVFTVDARRIQLTDSDGKLADVSATGRRTTVDSLSLTPGEYQVTVHAEGDYLLRVMDLGPRPSDYEGEPNDTPDDGQRLDFGSGVRGGFHRNGDLDHYLFRLDADSAIEIAIQPAGDGNMDVKLFRGRSQVGKRIEFKAGDAPYTFQSTLPAGDYVLVVRALEPTIQNPYEIGVARLPPLAGNEPDDNPLDAVKLPRDGDISGSVGAFDGADQVFVPLPQGDGVAAMFCRRAGNQSTGLWRFYNWADDGKVTDIRDGIAIFNYGPELGGAVRFGMDSTYRVVEYECSLRFPPLSQNAPDVAQVPQPVEAASEADASVLLSPGETRRIRILPDGADPQVRLNVEEGGIALVSCRSANGENLGAETRVWQLQNVDRPIRELLGDLAPFVARPEPKLIVSRTYAGRLDGATLPMEIDCSLYGADDLPRPADMGPPAELRIFDTGQSAAGGDGEGRIATGPPPPGLEALIARQAPERQPEGDLPVTITFAEFDEVAGFSESGQRFEVTAVLENEANSPLNLDLSFNVDGEGWRVNPASQDFTIDAGATGAVIAEVIAPPWLSPSLRPNLVVRATSGESFSAALVEIPVSADALPVNPFTYWHAPEALRGGLNVLHYGLGARLIDWGGKVPDEKMQLTESRLHDGLAPHIGSNNLPPEVVFRLAATAEIAGVMVQLRSVSAPESWPAEIEIYAPNSESGWRRVASAALESIHAPQYLVFDQAVMTDRLRFVFPRCNAKCQQPYVQELQAITVPGQHPPDLAPINAADLELGGHVVWSNQRFGGGWNKEFLVAIPSSSNSGWSLNRDQNPAQVVVAFHQNRAALLQSVVWVGDPDDTARIPEALVEASLVGSNGPWMELGSLPAPPLGQTRSSLTFETPVWARYLRFSFEIPEERPYFGPDAIEAIEAPGTSVLALWEDDQPRAAYESATKIQPSPPVPPAGGPSKEAGIELPLDDSIASSVVIERNEDWWRLTIPDGPLQRLNLGFERDRPLVVAEAYNGQGEIMTFTERGGPGQLDVVLKPGEYHLRVYEPPRSVVISWDTSGSVSKYIPRTLAAVRTWGRSLQPGRDALQLLPFGPSGFLLEDWAETPQALEPALRELREEGSSDSERAMLMAATALADRQGARGIVIMTDAETGMNADLWPALLEAMPRVVSLSVDSDSRQNAAIMMDWAALNSGRFQRVIGPLGLADGMEMANALFRAPKPYGLTATLEELIEPEGETTLVITPSAEAGPVASGAVELILDASGSMLQRMEGQRRIDIAHHALTTLVRDTLPEGTPFAFRAFGLEEDACRTELVIPLGPLDRAAAEKEIVAVPAINLAKTAIADSLKAAAKDLEGATPPRVVVLVTDGEETCGGDPEAVISQLRDAGFDARINIVGFAIDDVELQETFAAWATAGGGTYFDAGSAEALERSISEAMRPRFDISRTYLDGRVEVIGSAALGEKMTVPAGQLTITPGSGATGRGVTVQAVANEAIAVDYAPGEGLGLAGDAGDSPK